jgi:hypothetical protein
MYFALVEIELNVIEGLYTWKHFTYASER